MSLRLQGRVGVAIHHADRAVEIATGPGGDTAARFDPEHFRAMCLQDLPDLDSQVERGDFAPLLGWLRRSVHRYGRKFTPNELLERATGKPLTAAPWIAYVRQKFSALYALQKVPS